jgi:hypothetical protein
MGRPHAKKTMLLANEMMRENHKLLIKGLTLEGRTFRPSDWAQRLTTAVGTPGPGRRVQFHPKVHMATIDGVNCVVVDGSLQEEDPRLYQFLVSFGKNNGLQIEERDEAEASH